MKTAFNFKKLIASTALLAAAMGVSLSAEAGPVEIGSGLNIDMGNDYVSYATFQSVIGPSFIRTGDIVDTGVYSRDFSGFDSKGNPITTSFTAQAFAQSAYGTLKTYVTGELINPINENIYNLPFAMETGETNEEGMPTLYEAGASALFSDILTILPSDSESLSYIKVQLALSGELNATHSKIANTRLVQAEYYFENDSRSYTDLFLVESTSTNQTFDERIWSTNIAPLLNNQFLIGFALDSKFTTTPFTTGPINYQDSGIYRGTSDFFNTLNVTSIVGFNAAGQQVNLTSAIGASGTHYTVAAPVNPGTSIPEPASLALLGIGLVGVGWARRRS